MRTRRIRNAPQNAAAIGDFGSKPYIPRAIERRQGFALHWEDTKASLRQRGWSSFKPAPLTHYVTATSWRDQHPRGVFWQGLSSAFR
jgi:hypothetical protein